MTASDTIDLHFSVREARHEPNLIGKWYAARRGKVTEFLCSDGTVKKRPLGCDVYGDSLFETYADLETAYQLWLKREAKQ